MIIQHKHYALFNNSPFSDVDGLLLQIGPKGLDGQVADLRIDGIVVVQHHRHFVARSSTRCTGRRRGSCRLVDLINRGSNNDIVKQEVNS